MKKYKKKPITIEAIQWPSEWPSHWPSPSRVIDDCVVIETLEGIMTGYPGDYIIRGVNGELYPCKEDIFKKTYSETNCNMPDVGQRVLTKISGETVIAQIQNIGSQYFWKTDKGGITEYKEGTPWEKLDNLL